MEKRVFFGLIVGTQFIVSSLAQADTTFVSGTIDTNTVWDTAGSPYIVIDTVLVDSGVTLNIEPGVEVRIDSAKSIMIKGNLYAMGTVADSIIISARYTTKRWDRLWFKPASSCTLKYCRIEYAGNSAIYGESTSYLYIGYNTIYNNLGFYSNLIRYGGGIYSAGICDIISNTISNNSASISGYGCTSYGGGIYASGSANIINNTFSYNHADGVNGVANGYGYGGAIYTSGISIIKDNVISYNSCYGSGHYGSGGNGGGICNLGQATISNNIILNNSAGGSSQRPSESSGGGIYSSNWAIISNNIISKNIASGNGGQWFGYAGGGGISCQWICRDSK
ncbi:MAG: hypothetical protein HY769_00230 [Candidatus Stahlbacteria bacterium]|nr:hypothetical protein [Candidatus Stahlbacteria bacterium]